MPVGIGDHAQQGRKFRLLSCKAVKCRIGVDDQTPEAVLPALYCALGLVDLVTVDQVLEEPSD